MKVGYEHILSEARKILYESNKAEMDKRNGVEVPQNEETEEPISGEIVTKFLDWWQMYIFQNSQKIDIKIIIIDNL